MSLRRTTDRGRQPQPREDDAPIHPAPVEGRPGPRSGFAQRRAGPHSLDEAEERYVVARDAWTAAMRAANSGRPADLASLAITQEAYELALAEVRRWRSGARVAIPIEPDAPRVNLEIAVEHEVSWRQMHDHEVARPRGLRGLFGRIRGKADREPPDR